MCGPLFYYLFIGQAYRDDEIVAEKLANEDFIVYVTPVFVIDGEEYRVVTDGHHSFEAAKLAGVDPIFVEQSIRENDNIAIIESGQIELFMEHAYVDTDWYDIETGCWAFLFMCKINLTP